MDKQKFVDGFVEILEGMNKSKLPPGEFYIEIDNRPGMAEGIPNAKTVCYATLRWYHKKCCHTIMGYSQYYFEDPTKEDLLELKYQMIERFIERLAWNRAERMEKFRSEGEQDSNTLIERLPNK